MVAAAARTPVEMSKLRFLLAPVLFGAVCANCAITFQVKEIDQELSRRPLDSDRSVFFTDRRFRLVEEMTGPALLLRLTGTATRNELRRTRFAVRYRKAKTIRYGDGDYRLRFRALFWTDDYAAPSWRDYALGNLALLFPTLALSGVVMLADLVTLPLRLLETDREARTKEESDETLERRPDWSPADFRADCDGRSLAFRAGRARLPLEALLPPPGRWRGTILCSLKDGDREFLRHAIHLDRLALRSPTIRARIAASQPLILRELALRTRAARKRSPSARNDTGAGAGIELDSLEAIIDLTRYLQPAGRPQLLRVKEIGEDLFYVEPEKLPALLDELERRLRAAGY